MDHSILSTIKKLCGIDTNDTSFDVDMVVFINTAISALRQIGIGPKNGFAINGYSETWSSLIDSKRFEDVKTYIYLRTRMLFDPPTSSMVGEAFNNSIKELEWRLNVETSMEVDDDEP